MTAVAVASSSQLAADAGAAVAAAGGNAIDAAIAACLTSMTTEPGVCSLGASGYITIWPRSGSPVTIDGYADMPGIGLNQPADPAAAWPIELSYGGGMKTIVGYGSVAVPGGVAAFGLASEHFGRLPWKEVVEPARAIAESGFPMPSNCRHYLECALDPVIGWQEHGRRAFVDDDGDLIATGGTVRMPGLADSLERIGRLGPQEFYTGDLGNTIADYVSGNGGALNRQDMVAYRAVERKSLDVVLDEWHIATSPPPGVGGATLAAMLLLMHSVRHDGWNSEAVRRLVEIQHAVFGYRHHRLDGSRRIREDIAALLDMAHAGMVPGQSSATVHTSTTDANGVGCSITMSAGYGSGVTPPETGVWLNNSLGEIELIPEGGLSAAPGTRLSSNMAPSVAHRGDGAVLATGSPGADRITSAILQMLVNFIHFGQPLDEAVAQPRAHVERGADGYLVAHEPGLPMDLVTLPLRPFEHLSMYFGGVGAALWDPETGFSVASDPRRQGGTAISGDS
jgi:gamma-glutamyltranspeptidase/glutathione hydrolase